MEQKPGDLEGLAKATGKAIEKETQAVPKPKDLAPTEDVPDPDEDDLDDLDGKFHKYLLNLH
jgi:peroxin-19